MGKQITMDYEEYLEMEKAIENLKEFKKVFSTRVEAVAPYVNCHILIIDAEKLKDCIKGSVDKIIIKYEGDE